MKAFAWRDWAGLLAVAVSPTFMPVACLAEPLDGAWRSQGYGYVFDVQPAAFKAFEVTSTTCVPGFTATLSKVTASDRDATFTTSDRDVFFVRAGGSDDHKVLHFDGSASDMRIDRLPRLPAACEHPTPDTPLDNFEVFARTWAEHYISFDLKNADWDKILAASRPKINPDMTAAQLFDVLEGMIRPFGDAHTSIYSPGLKRRFHGIRAGTDRVVMDLVGEGGFEKFQSSGMHKLFDVTKKAYVHGPLKKYCNGQIEFGRLGTTTGYLRIVSFSDYSKQHDFASGLTALQAALDEIFSDSTLKSLVIDVRVNFGGEEIGRAHV